METKKTMMKMINMLIGNVLCVLFHENCSIVEFFTAKL